MFSGFFGREKATKTILLVDVGSGSVGAALARLNSRGKPTLLTSSRAPFPLRLTRSGAKLTEDAVAATQTAIEDIRTKAASYSEGGVSMPQRIEHVAFFLAAPWSATQIREIRFSRSKEFKMSASVLERMLTEDERANKQDTQGRLIERTALSLRLNGYPVDSVGNLPVLTVDVSLATSHATEPLVDALADIAHHLPGDPAVTFHSFALPAVHALLSAYPQMQDTLIIDAGAEITEIIRVQHGIPEARATAPAGSHLLLRTLAAHAHMGKREAESALALAKSEGTRLSHELKAPLEDAAAQWVKKVGSALKPLAASGLPPFVFLFGDERATRWLSDALASASLPSAHTPIVPQVQPVVADTFLPFVESVEQNPDPFFLCELLYADTRFDEGKSLALMSTQENAYLPSRATISRT